MELDGLLVGWRRLGRQRNLSLLGRVHARVRPGAGRRSSTLLSRRDGRDAAPDWRRDVRVCEPRSRLSAIRSNAAMVLHRRKREWILGTARLLGRRLAGVG